MHTELIYVVGAGGHAKVVIDALLAGGTALARLRICDSNAALHGANVMGIGIEALPADFAGAGFHVAVGAGEARATLFASCAARDGKAVSVIHPAAVVARSARLDAGVFLAARCVIGPDSALGRGVIVNHGAVVDHDCHVGEFSHIAPNATLGGAVKVHEYVLVGAGANLLPGMNIGAGAVIGAGSVVLQNVLPGRTCVGVPASFKEKGLN